MFDFTQILANAEIIKEKLKKPEPIERTYNLGGTLYKGHPFIVKNIKTGDCKRFNNLLELNIELKYKIKKGTSGPALKNTLKSERFRKKYEWFAWEWELLGGPRLALM